MADATVFITSMKPVMTPLTAPYTPQSVTPKACRMTREVTSPTTIITSIRKYRRIVFRAILLLFSDMVVPFRIGFPVKPGMTLWPAPTGHLYSGL